MPLQQRVVWLSLGDLRSGIVCLSLGDMEDLHYTEYMISYMSAFDRCSESSRSKPLLVKLDADSKRNYLKSMVMI